MEFNKRNVKIFVLSGKAGSGKNYASRVIKEYYKDSKVISISFAYYLKDYAKRIFGWDGLEETKPREFLQNLGIELIKNNIDDKFLINRLKQDIEIFSYFYDIIIITDARLKDELEEIKKTYECTTIRIKSDRNIKNLSEKELNHLSETDLDDYNNFDYVIENNGSLENLKEEILKVVGEA